MIKMRKDARIFIAGGKSLAGRAFFERLKSSGFNNILSDCGYGFDYRDQALVRSFFQKERPEYVYIAYVKSGNIAVNSKYPADFIYDNLQSQTNIIYYSYKFGVKKLIFLASSCIYPGDSIQPIREDFLLSGELEKTSEPYAIAKIAGIKMCQAYNQQYGLDMILPVPATLYGPEDDFNLESGHVISSLIRKFHQAAEQGYKRKVRIWGTGEAQREFLYIDDFVDACIFLIDNYDKPEIINLGSGREISIRKLAYLIRDIVGFRGEIIFDSSKPEGVIRKFLDSDKIKRLGWQSKISLEDGIQKTYEWYKKNLV